MMIFIKKWNLFLLCVIMIAGVLSFGILVRRDASLEVDTIPGYGKRIIVDAGHGEPDGGAISPGGVLEKDLNLAIAGFLQGYLEQSGISVIMTRTDDSGIFDSGSKTIRQKKRSDLANREKIIEESGADLFVSIHMNQFQDAKYSGPQVFYSVNHPSSKALAESVQKEMNAILEPERERVIKPAGKEIYLLKSAKLPAILAECGFLSNPREEKLLTDESYQKRTAWAIYCGIIKYLSVN